MRIWFLYLSFGNRDEFGVTPLFERSYDAHNDVTDVQVGFRDAGWSFRNDFSDKIPSENQWKFDGFRQCLIFYLSDSADQLIAVTL